MQIRLQSADEIIVQTGFVNIVHKCYVMLNIRSVSSVTVSRTCRNWSWEGRVEAKKAKNQSRRPSGAGVLDKGAASPLPSVVSGRGASRKHILSMKKP